MKNFVRRAPIELAKADNVVLATEQSLDIDLSGTDRPFPRPLSVWVRPCRPIVGFGDADASRLAIGIPKDIGNHHEVAGAMSQCHSGSHLSHITQGGRIVPAITPASSHPHGCVRPFDALLPNLQVIQDLLVILGGSDRASVV